MRTKTLGIVAVVGLVALAGCTGGMNGGDAGTDDGEDTNLGTVNLYISDQPNAIDDFEHLNVTVTEVGFNRVNVNESSNQSNWETHEVDNVTVDLTKLKGENATMIDEYDVPNGTYSKVFVYVDEINATLDNGEQVNVKLPSEKLHVNKNFTVGNNESIDFVFDISVHKAGKSGKYILKPVVSESGTDVPMNQVDREDDEHEEDEEEDERGVRDEGDKDDKDDEDGDSQQRVNINVEGNVTAGENVTVTATVNGSAVTNTSVSVNDEDVGRTNETGRITVQVPEEEFEIEIEKNGMEGELEIENVSSSSS
ncbi:DUF4382 domain-containing protein [Halorutilales archaeon Cl-col2-1]